MIIDIFSNRYPDFETGTSQDVLFVQLFNIYDDPYNGLHKTLNNKISEYKYSSFADEHIRIISLAIKNLCNELGYKTIDKPLVYINPNYGYEEYRLFVNYIHDPEIKIIEKISLLEIIYREAEHHIIQEIEFLNNKIPEYQALSDAIRAKSRISGCNYHDTGSIFIEKAIPLLEEKNNALTVMREEINIRLKQHKTGLHYHNGYFQKEDVFVIEKNIKEPFWGLVFDSKYKNVEEDMLEAIDRYDNNGKDPALYAAKALESMIKIICNDKGLTTNEERSAPDFINHLNAKKHGPIISNNEKEELLSMFRTRNPFGHGAGDDDMPKLPSIEVIRYINSAMVWIVNLSLR